MQINKSVHFISGMPRSGSTLLCNILAQNPQFHATATSGILDIIFSIRNQWDELIEFKAAPNPEAKKRVLQAILNAYYADVEKPVVLDKSRGWLAYIEMAEMILGESPKILVPARDIRDILSSFEKLWRKSADTTQFQQERDNYFKWQTVEGRCEVWTSQEQTVGLAYNRIKDALARGHKDKMHFVRYEDLTTHPERTLRKIYEFLQEEPFDHDFNNVEQVTWENDAIHGIKDLHTIRPKVAPQAPQWPEILGDAAKPYEGTELW